MGDFVFKAAFNLLLAAMAAYAFSRFRFRGRRLGLLSLLLVQVFPQYVMFIALATVVLFLVASLWRYAVAG